MVSINDDDLPADVDVEFEEGSYTVAEGANVTVKVTLSEDPDRSVTVGIVKAEQGGASSADYSGVPASVTFNSGETSKTFTFTATDDSVDDDGESVKLTFTNLPTGVTEGTTKETEVSITDDDDPSVTVEFGSATYSVEESDDTTTTEDKENEAVVTVKLNADPKRTVAVPIVKTNQGDASSADYSGVPASVTFNSGETSKTFTFAATSDTVDDDGESVKLTFTNLPTGVTEGTTKETVVSINDDDLPADVDVEFEEGSYTVAEGSNVTVKVTLSEDPDRSVTVGIVKAEQGGASSADYSGVPASVTFNSGETSKTFTFTATSDTVDDDGESVKLTFTNLPTGVTEGTTKETVVSINDDDLPADVDVEFEEGSYTVAEGSNVTVKVTLSEDPDRSVTVGIVKAEQGGASSADYSGVPASVTFNSGETSKTFTFTATSDTVDDDGESVKLTFTNLPTGVTEGTTKETVVSINDDDLPADVDVEFEEGSYTVAEGSNVTVKVTLSEDPDRSVTVGIVKAEQGGASSADYSGVPASVTFNSGETSKTFTFTATSDTVDDDGESVKLTFTNLPTGVTEGTTKETEVSINDDDLPADVDVEFEEGSYTVAEGSNVTVKVTLSEDPERSVTVGIVKADQGGASSADYSGVPASVTFGPTETEKTFTFTATADTVDDDGESVKLTFTNLPSGVTEGATKQTEVSITDDDSNVIQRQTNVSVSFKISAYSVPEGGTASIKITLSDDPGKSVEIPVSVTGGMGITDADYSGVPLTVTFSSGDTEKAFAFTAIQDQDDEDVETVTLAFGDLPEGVSEGSITEATVSIRDSLRVSFVAAEYSAYEGGDNAVVSVKLDGPAIQETVIPLNAAGMNGATSDDWSGVPDEITFAVGEISKRFPVVAVDDTVEDDDESVQLSFGNLPAGVVEGNPDTATVVLMNMEMTTANTQCPGNSGRRIILDSQGTITVAGESQFWRLNLDPYRIYLIEVFGSDSERDVTGADLPSEDLTLPDPRVIGFYDDDKSVHISFNTVGNRLTLIRGSTESGWHRIEVSGSDETGTYRIRIRVNDVCRVTDGLAVYPYFGGPDGYTLDIPANTSSTRRISIRQTGTMSILGDNWDWYWDSEPDVDWFKAISLEAGQTYNIKAWAPEGFPSEHQATDLKIAGVYDSSGNLISGTASSTSGKKVTITFEPAADGEYYIAVGSGNRDRTGVYKLSIEGLSLTQ